MKKRDENISIVAKQQISFKIQAAMDYFGHYSQNEIYQENVTSNSSLLLLLAETVFKTDFLADVLINMAWRGGFGDWWYDRRVMLTCQDIKSDCNKPGNADFLAAYYYKPEPQDPAHYDYPNTCFLPFVFRRLSSSSDNMELSQTTERVSKQFVEPSKSRCVILR